MAFQEDALSIFRPFLYLVNVRLASSDINGKILNRLGNEFRDALGFDLKHKDVPDMEAGVSTTLRASKTLKTNAPWVYEAQLMHRHALYAHRSR